MLRLSVKSVRGHLVRFLLTAFAVTLGVAFVAGSFVLRDSIDATLDNLITAASKGVDVSVRGTLVDPSRADGARRPLPIGLADRLASVEGVARSSPDLTGTVMIVGEDGVVVRNSGAPTMGFAFSADDPAFTVRAGRGPGGPGEIAVERVTLAKSGLAVGDTTTAVIAGEVRSVRITGEVEFGSLFGATAVLLDATTARAAFSPDGTVSSITLSARSDLTQEVLRTRVAPVLPPGAEAVTGQEVTDSTRDTVAAGLGFFTTFLMVFAGITLFVGAFIIVNTFSILLAQRTRELALLRALGASRAQVRRMVLGEAVLVGLLGSAAGIALGTALASALKIAAKSAAGIDITGGLPVHVRTVVISVVVGTVVTVLSAWLPSHRASRIPPVAALRLDAVVPPSGVRYRGLAGSVVGVVGAALLTVEVIGDDVNWIVAGTGAALTVLGLLAAAPLAARPVVHLVVAPFLLTGVVARLAARNAVRVPTRTANTAGALMIGLALVSALAVTASSVKASVADVVGEQLTSDFVLTAGGQAVPSGVTAGAARLPGVRSLSTFSAVEVTAGDLRTYANVTTGATLADHVRMDILVGSADALDRGEILVDQSTATAQGWRLGSDVTATVGTLPGQRLRIGGIYADSRLLESGMIVGQDLYRRAVPASTQQAFLVLVRADDGADQARLRQALLDVARPYVVVTVDSGEEYVDATASQVDQLVGLLYVLLALAVVIAVLGIVNTLALSVVERTREIGLLRAVGLGRLRLASMIAIEAVATAVFGAVLGAGLGLGLGVALQRGLRSEGLEILAIPWTTIVGVLVASAGVGVAASVVPAVRAVRLNILEAIATE